MNALAGNAIYISNFLRAIGIYLPYLVYSTFLSLFVPEEYVGFIFTAGSLLATVVVLAAPILFRRFRTHRVLNESAVIAAVSLAGLAVADTVWTVLFLFTSAWISGWIVALSLDVILEKIVGTEEGKTGFSRGFFLTASNGAVVLSSFIVAIILTNSDYWRVFLIGAGAFALCAYLSARFFSEIPHVEHNALRVRDVIRNVLANRSLAAIMGSHLLMQMLFTWSLVYIPLYLHNHGGYSWSAIGTVMALAVFSFVILQVPVGRLADAKYGEKEFIILGFLIAGLSFIGLSAGIGTGFLLLFALIVGTQIGGALLEIATESYFFKQVGPADSEVIGFFRALRQMATVAAPLIGSVVLFSFSFEYAFIAFGTILLLGIPLALLIKDTR